MTRLGENVETEVETIIAQLCGCIDTGTLSKYGKNSRVEDVEKRQNKKYEKYIETIAGLGQWYLMNINTYQDSEEGKATGHRKRYVYNNISLGDDCSSFVYATLYLSGLIDIEKYPKQPFNAPRAVDYIDDPNVVKMLEESGFKWYPKDEISCYELVPGDILVRDNQVHSGHVEIFYGYDEETGEVLDYTWGRIYKIEPVNKGKPSKLFDDNNEYHYEGVWRYEGE